jgi:amidase
VIPVSKQYDSVGPICRTVSDVAIMLQAISGPDKSDPFTSEQPPVPDYVSALSLDFLAKKRIGVLRGYYTDRAAWKMDDSEEAYEARLEAFEDALKALKDLGAEVVDSVEIATVEELFENREKEKVVFRTEFKVRDASSEMPTTYLHETRTALRTIYPSCPSVPLAFVRWRTSLNLIAITKRVITWERRIKFG